METILKLVTSPWKRRLLDGAVRKSSLVPGGALLPMLATRLDYKDAKPVQNCYLFYSLT